MFERWGAISVKDHLDTQALVTNLLMYDRLVIPVPSGDEEIKRWETQNWDPSLLNKRLDELGDLAIQKRWDGIREQQYRKAMREVKDVAADANDIIREQREELPYQMSRKILAQEKQTLLPPGVSHVEVVSAHNSLAAFSEDFILEESEGRKDLMAVLFGQKIAVPEDKPEYALQKMIDLSRDAEFKAKRRAFYDWQDSVLEKGYEPKSATEEMEQLIRDYNHCVERAVNSVYLRYAFTIGGVALGLLGAGLGSPLATASAFLSLASFATFDRRPAIEPGESKPAAMFHDVKKVLGWKSSDSG